MAAAQQPQESKTPHKRVATDGADCRFERASRLLTPAQFSPVFKNNFRSADKFWTVLFKKNESDQPRLGMAVAKKKIKRAVDRNRVKRITRESFRTQTNLPGVDVVVLPSANCQSAGNSELRASLDKHWARITLKCAAR